LVINEPNLSTNLFVNQNQEVKKSVLGTTEA